MNIFDLVVSALVLIFFVIGLKRGFITEVFRLIAVICGFIVSWMYYKQFIELISFLKMPDTIKTVISFIVIYIIIALSVLIVGWIVKKIIHLSMFGWLDRLLGGFFGVVKVILIIWAIISVFLIFPNIKNNGTLNKSYTFKIFTLIPFKIGIDTLKIPQSGYKQLNKLKEIESTGNKISDFKKKIDSLRNNTI